MLRILMLVVIASFLEAAILPLHHQSLEGRIVGGKMTSIRKYPHQALLEYHNEQLCGASVISENIIITAAHCLQRRLSKFLTVRVGTTYSGLFGQVHSVKRFIVHENFTMHTTDYDVALVFLTEPITYSEVVAPVSLTKNGIALVPDSMVTITGWGAMQEGGRSPLKLREAFLPIVAHNVCQQRYDRVRQIITPRMFCAGLLDVGGVDTCQGDSGGPVLQNGKLVGIVSWGWGCGRKFYPGVYTNVAMVRDWIKQHAKI